MKKKLLYVVNVDWFFLTHRLPIALEALRQGYEVHVAAGITDKKAEIEKHGLIVHPLGLVRGKESPLSALKSFLELIFLFRAVKPDVVHLVTIKPVLFGGIAAKIAGVPRVVAAISGLGFIFIAEGALAALRRFVVLLLYRMAVGGKKTHVIFQNIDDRDSLIQGAGLDPSQAYLIRGSGVDLKAYTVTPEPEADPVIVLPARLLKDKGVCEFVEAARILKQKGVKARFCLIGNTDPDNPASLTDAEVDAWVREGVVEAWGYQSDFATALAKANLVVLPSYREGLPKALIDAAACGRAVITTDVPGCRDAITPNETGLLVPVKDAPALADAIEELLNNPAKRKEMAIAGRTLAESVFDIREVVRRHLEIYTPTTKKPNEEQSNDG